MRVEPESSRCISDTRVDPVAVRILWDELIYSDNRALKCYVECVYSGMNFVNREGKFVHDEIVQNVEKVTYAMVDKCIYKTEGIQDRCDRVFEFDKCLLFDHEVFAL